LYGLTSRMLLAMARKYLYDKSYAEDLVSETYLKIVQGSSKFDSSQNGLNWIYKIVHNGAIDINRRNSNSTVAAEIHDCQGISDIDDLLNTILVNNAIDKLSFEEKQIIYWRYWEGLRFAEIAERLHKSVSTTHDIIKKTLKKLQQLMSL
ncbi:MAG: sigma-70 family RNA polymerase sigma factor, partial [Clostridia bacterium]|nr:sigma-70 family RNA polymerase sigma factor [Clostridia bacterium]